MTQVFILLLAGLQLMASAPAAARKRKVRNPFQRGTIGHVKHGIAYHVANSRRGWILMRRFGKKWADLDLQVTLDGVIVVCHWPKFGLRDGFTVGWRKIGKKNSTPIGHLTWREVQQLRTKEGYRIWSLDEAFRELAKLGLGAYLEPKGAPRLRNQGVWNQIKDMADSFGVKLRGYTLKANADCLPFMRHAGIPSHALKK